MAGRAGTDRAEAVLRDALADPTVSVAEVDRIDGGRGVFSEVERCTFADGRPPLVVKHAATGPNRAAAIASGAYRREASAYRSLLPRTPTVAAPRCHGIADHDDGAVSVVLDDLSGHRAVDQLDGLPAADVALVAIELSALHAEWAERVGTLDLRRNTPSLLSSDGLAAGREAVHERWSLPADLAGAFDDVLDERERLVSAFARAGSPTLCHGDARADNVVFTSERAVMFDWQQMAVQFGEADLAWLLATSTTPEVRRAVEADVVASYAIVRNQDAASTWNRYRLGMVLPGLAVLMLAQREADETRTRAFIETSLRRVATAIGDLDVAGAT